jgi:hypothetical protein
MERDINYFWPLKGYAGTNPLSFMPKSIKPNDSQVACAGNLFAAALHDYAQ